MFTGADIRRVSIAVSGGDYSRLIVRLGRSGLLHLETGEVPEGKAEPAAAAYPGIPVDSAKAEKILSAALEFIGKHPQALMDNYDYGSLLDDAAVLFSIDCERDERYINRVMKKHDQYLSVKSLLKKQLSSSEGRLRELLILRECGIDLYRLRDLQNISYIYGTLQSMDWLTDAGGNWFYIINREYVFCALPYGEKNRALKVFRSCGFEDLSGIVRTEKTLEEAVTSAEKRAGDLKRRLAGIDSFYETELAEWKEKIAHLAAVYSVILKITGAEKKLRFTGDLVFVSGWIDLRDADALHQILRDVCGERFYLRIATAVENRRFRGSIPVILKNIRMFRPFELLVKMMGMPGNSEVDPTPAAAIAYVVIFGVMFGDAGQGLVLAAAGMILHRYGMSKHRERNNISDFGSIMIWCGISAAIFGLLYGSIFSNEHMIPAVLFHPMERMMELFLMAVMMGVVFISTGLTFNILNNLIAGHYGESLFGARGAAGLAVYLSFIFFVMRYILSGVMPAPPEMAGVLVIPALLFCLRGPLGYLFFHGDSIFPHGVFEYAVESVIEIIEMFSGFIGNTISFIRAGAFALSHAGLSIAVYTLASIVDPGMKSAAAVSVIVVGNIFIILLEGLVCGIQSMRLEYYEFFGKFFKGDGVAFAPFSLRFK